MSDHALSEFPARLAPLDWIVIAAYALGIVAIGWYYSRRTRDGEDYLVGGRRMNPIAVGLSFFVALFSTITYLAIPGEMIRYGPVIFLGLLSYPLVHLIVGWWIIPAFMKLNVRSGYELLGSRLGVAPRMLGVGLFLVMRLLWMAVIVFATVDKVLVPLSGLPASATPYLSTALAGLAVVYTTMGGLKAIVTVDVIQAALLFGGVLLALATVTQKLGGVGALWPDAWPGHWPELQWISGETSDRVVIAAIVSRLVWYVCTAGSDQMAVQRYLATRNVGAARRMFGISLLAGIVIQLILGGLGLALLSYVMIDPSWAPGIDVQRNADRLFPTFIATMMPPGVAGLIIAGLLAEALNSLSSGISAASGVINTDLMGRQQPVHLDSRQEVRRLRIISASVGASVVALSVGVGLVQGNLLELSYKVVNLLTAPLFSLFFLALFVRRATSLGALSGALAGVLVTMLVNYWREIAIIAARIFELQIDPRPPISFLWGTPLSFVVAAAFGILVSRCNAEAHGRGASPRQ